MVTSDVFPQPYKQCQFQKPILGHFGTSYSYCVLRCPLIKIANSILLSKEKNLICLFFVLFHFYPILTFTGQCRPKNNQKFACLSFEWCFGINISTDSIAKCTTKHCTSMRECDTVMTNVFDYIITINFNNCLIGLFW